MNLYFLLEAGITAVLIVVAFLLPSLVPPTVRLGVRVPQGRVLDPAVQAAERRYRAGVVAAAVIALGLLAAEAWLWPSQILLLSPFVFMAGMLGSYWWGRHGLLAAKAAGRWAEEGPASSVASLAPEKADRGWLVWFVLPSGVWLVFLIAGVLVYSSLPQTLPTHFGASGAPDAWSPKSYGTVLFGSEVGAVILGLFGGLSVAISRHRSPLDPSDPARDSARQTIFRARMVRALLVLGTMTELTVGAASLITWGRLPSTGVGTLAVVLPILVGLGVVVAISVRTGQLGSKVRFPSSPDVVPLATRPAHPFEDDRFWPGGLVYYNRGDSSLLVAKRFGVGYTLNFGNPWSWILLVALVAVPLGLTLLLT
jgi:uncharacterized membrane protein